MAGYYLLKKILAADMGSYYSSYQSFYLKCAKNASTFEEALTNCITSIQNFLLYFVPSIAILSFIIAGVIVIFYSFQPDKIRIAKTIVFYTVLGLLVVFGIEILLQVVKYIFGR